MDRSPSEEILQYYRSNDEANRLGAGPSRLEFARTRELVERFLPPPKAVVLDVGGAAGAYSCWLAGNGYEVHLIEPTPHLLAQAREAARDQPGHPIASLTAGDARDLEWDDASVDAVLMLGPLYHLTERKDRVLAMRQAFRALREGGLFFGAAISRFASTMDGLFRGLLDDPRFVPIARRDLEDGQHRNETGNPLYFTTAFFHHPRELEEEAKEAGFRLEGIFGVEGPAWLLQNFDHHWEEEDRRERLLMAVRAVEREPSLLGASAHLLVCGRKPSD